MHAGIQMQNARGSVIRYLDSAYILLEGPLPVEARQKHVQHMEGSMHSKDSSGDGVSACSAPNLVSASCMLEDGCSRLLSVRGLT